MLFSVIYLWDRVPLWTWRSSTVVAQLGVLLWLMQVSEKLNWVDWLSFRQLNQIQSFDEIFLNCLRILWWLIVSLSFHSLSYHVGPAIYAKSLRATDSVGVLVGGDHWTVQHDSTTTPREIQFYGLFLFLWLISVCCFLCCWRFIPCGWCVSWIGGFLSSVFSRTILLLLFSTLTLFLAHLREKFL